MRKRRKCLNWYFEKVLRQLVRKGVIIKFSMLFVFIPIKGQVLRHCMHFDSLDNCRNESLLITLDIHFNGDY